jgi:dienelactone hydrolase
MPRLVIPDHRSEHPMSTRFRAVAVLLLAMSAAALPAQTRRALTHDDYDGWKSLRGTALSQDGRWVAYQIEPQFGDGVLVVRQTDGEVVYQEARGTDPRFAVDGCHAVFTIAKSKVEERQKKIDELKKQLAEKAKGEKTEKPEKAEKTEKDDAAKERGELAILDLQTGKVERFGAVKGFTVPDDAAVVVYHLDKPEADKDKADKKDAGAAAAKPAAGEGETKPEAKPEAKPEKKPADPLEKKRADGTALVVRDLRSGQERRFDDVVGYGLTKKATWLWFHTSAKKPAADKHYGLFALRLRSGDLAAAEVLTLVDGIANFANFATDKTETGVAFTCDKFDFAADKPRSDVFLWNCDSLPAQRVVHAGTPGLPADKRPGGNLAFCRDGTVLAFGLSQPPDPDPVPILADEKVVLDIWHWNDGQLQTQQQKRTGRRHDNVTACWRRGDGRLVVLGDQAAEQVNLIAPDGSVGLGSDSQPYEKLATWDGHYADVYVVDGRDGARTRVLEKLRGSASASPDGHFVLWFGPDYHWWVYDVASKQRRDLTGALPVPFHRTDDDHPEPDPAHGVAGWTADDAGVVLYDEFDLWRVSPTTGAAVCLTAGFGRAANLRLRVQIVDKERECLPDTLLLTATNVNTMATGFFQCSATAAAAPTQLCMADMAHGELQKAKQADRFVFTRSTWSEFPDLWTAKADFADIRRLSDANPQQQEFRWGRAELVHWINADGKPLKGILVKPDDFDPAQKYPMLVSFYERSSQSLHGYAAPAPGTSPSPAYYVSNGFLWFMPDIVYEVGYPGDSCVKCVVSGVEHLIAQGFVDAQHIGACGHSWGGYQTAFLVTRTNIFAAVESGAPVCDMISAYGGIRYESGVSRQFQYEQQQSRIGGTPWQYPLRFWENSPIFFADRVHTPVLILHNDADGAVPWTNGIELFTALRRLGKECYLFDYVGEGHGLRKRQNQKDWARRMAEYFAHHLQGAPAPKWMTEGVPYSERDKEKLPFTKSWQELSAQPTEPAAVEAASKPSEAASGGDSPQGQGEGKPPEKQGEKPAEKPAPAQDDKKGKTDKPTEKEPMFKPGQDAPDFKCKDETGTERKLADFAGKTLVIWFYPKADTPG